MTATATPTWSRQQEAIFDWFANPTVAEIIEHTMVNARSRHLIVRARAGTGKSTTIREGVKRAPEQSILIAAFSKDIKLAMAREIGTGFPNIEVMTLHAVGYACVRRFRDNIKVAFNNDRADNLTERVCGARPPDAIKRLVSKLHTKGREIAPHATKPGDLTAIAITFECEPDEAWVRMGFGLEYVETMALAAMALAAEVRSGDTIDGSDMIFLPVRNGWLTKQYDLVVVDEAQDMTTAQLEIGQGVLNDGGRIAIVGDDRQAIFGFRGADSGSLDRLKVELNAAELGLHTTYRCGKAIVAYAQGLVPDFEAGPNNPEGEILSLPIEKLTETAGPGDFILSRVNAPIVSIAMKLLRAGKRTRVAGRDIGKGLAALIRKMKARSVPDLRAKIEVWVSRENARNAAQLAKATNGRRTAIQAKVEAVLDQAEMMVSLTDGARSVAEVEDRVEALFTDNGLGAADVITCSSVHRAKGLEANRVFILQSTLRNHSIEEQNITYVAVTRAKQTLVWVTDGEVSR
jgi:superfamily I DNA/RNA helicase